MSEKPIYTTPLADVLIAIFDNDQDKTISRSEWTKAGNGFTDEVFNEIDKKGEKNNAGNNAVNKPDNKISREELIAWCPALNNTFKDLDIDRNLALDNNEVKGEPGCQKFINLFDTDGDAANNGGVEPNELFELAKKLGNEKNLTLMHTYNDRIINLKDARNQIESSEKSEVTNLDTFVSNLPGQEGGRRRRKTRRRRGKRSARRGKSGRRSAKRARGRRTRRRSNRRN